MGLEVKFSQDLMVYSLMIILGVFVLYMGIVNEKSESGKILVTSGTSLFVVLFFVLFLLKLVSII